MPRGNVYVADMGNKRIQVFDNDGTFKTEIKNVGAPRAICISPGAHQYLYSSNSNPTEDPFLNGEIYKMELDGTVVGRSAAPASSSRSSAWSMKSTAAIPTPCTSPSS